MLLLWMGADGSSRILLCGNYPCLTELALAWLRISSNGNTEHSRPTANVELWPGFKCQWHAV